jgi:hypothetical protein
MAGRGGSHDPCDCPAPPANASTTCVGGLCGHECNPGFFDCNGNASDGCEANRICPVLATGLVNPLDVAADATHVYVAVGANLNGSGGYILAVARANGASTMLAGGEWSPRTLAVSDTHAFWANALGPGGVQDGRVRRVSLGGGMADTVSGPPMVYGWDMQVDGSKLVWAEQGFVNSYAGGLWVGPVDGSAQPARLPVDVEFVNALHVVGGTAYWSVILENQSQVLQSVSLATSAVTTIAQASATAIEVFEASLYFSTPGAIWVVPLAGGTPNVLVNGPINAVDLDIDGGALYWADVGTFGQTDGSVKKCDLMGNNVQTLASGQDGPYALTVSDDDVFYVDVDAGTLVRVPK